jgi:DNA repair exonuclease SbcCD ATPase subunit
MRVLNYEVHNMMRVSDMRLNMEGAHIFLFGGKNGQGKTSALSALLMALCGKSGFDFPEVALKEGESSGWVKVQLSGDSELHDDVGFTVELSYRRKRNGQAMESFRIIDSTGDEAAEPRAFLKRLYDLKAFDPLSFEQAKPKDREQLIRKILGLDFTELDERRAKLFSQRTSINRSLKEDEARRAAISYPRDTPDSRISVVALVDEKERAARHNAEVERQQKAESSIEMSISALDAEEARLLEKLKQCREAREAKHQELTAQQIKVRAMQVIDLSEIQSKIENAEVLNQAIEAKGRASELDTTIRQFTLQADKLTTEIEKIDDEKRDRMERADWPVKGLSLGENGVMLNGLPFEQASRAERIRASVKIAMAMNPKLRLMVSQDGSDCDMDTLKELEKMCREHDYQLILEFVTRTKEDEAMCAVVFRDGEAFDPKSDTPLFES